jgi:hypothetical protein
VSATPSFGSCTRDVVIDLNGEVNQQTLDAANGNNAKIAAATELAPKAHGSSGRFLRNSRTVGSEFCEVTSACDPRAGGGLSNVRLVEWYRVMGPWLKGSKPRAFCCITAQVLRDSE